MGAARGIDEGTIGTIATLPSFSKAFGLKDVALSKSQQANRLSNVTSMVQLGSIAGCAFAFYISDRFGRIRATQQLCVVWILGVIIAMLVFQDCVGVKLGLILLLQNFKWKTWSALCRQVHHGSRNRPDDSHSSVVLGRDFTSCDQGSLHYDVCWFRLFRHHVSRITESSLVASVFIRKAPVLTLTTTG